MQKSSEASWEPSRFLAAWLSRTIKKAAGLRAVFFCPLLIPSVHFRVFSPPIQNGFVGALELFHGLVPMEQVHEIDIE
jgi:hypothetical protein